ncbi:MAG: APC family permease [Synechococcaceae cyanobacterium]|nr:APC family permease [Synechococcaceae cyanobacterium]
MTPPQAPAPSLTRSLGRVDVTAQAVASIGLTLTAVINIPEAARHSGHATALSYALALVVVLLVAETLVLFRHQRALSSGIAGYIAESLGRWPGALATWSLLLGYAGAMLACLVYFGFYLNHALAMLGLAPIPLAGFVIGGFGCLELARRDVGVSTRTMLVSEAISVLIVLGLCVLILRRGGASADLAALSPLGDTPSQVRAGLMVAVLSFIGFESAATLGEETPRPERTVPLAIRLSVLFSGVLFLTWSVLLIEGLDWLSPAERLGLDPIALLAVRLGDASGGDWIRAGAFLCLFGSTLASLTALGRVAYDLARRGILPAPLARIHPRFHTPSNALVATTLPLLLVGAALELQHLSVSQLFDQLGGFTVLAFLLVYGLVAASALLRNLPQVSRTRRMLVGAASLTAVVAVAAGFLWSVVGSQNQMLLCFLLLLGVGVVLVSLPRPEDRPDAAG